MVVDIKQLSSMEKVFLDEAPKSGEFTNATALKGERFSYQIAISQQEEEIANFEFKVESDFPCDVSIFEVGNVPVTMPCYKTRDENYLRTTPGVYPDILNPKTDGKLRVVHGQWKSLWISVDVPEDIDAKEYKFSFTLTHKGEACAEKKFDLKVLGAVLPPQELIFTQWFHNDCLASHYGCEIFSEKHWEIIEKFMLSATKFGINMIFVPMLTPALDTAVGTERPTVQLVDVTRENGKYIFGFEKLERYIKLAQKCGYKYFEFAHLFTQWGALHAPKVVAKVGAQEKRIFGWDTDHNDPEYVNFLKEMLGALKVWLKEYGIFNNCFFHISDEPNAKSKETYAQNVGNLKEVLSDCNVIDALSNYEYYEEGLVKHPIPAVDEIEPFIQNKVPDLWAYYCCMQRVDVSNHFIAMPGARTRILATALFKYNIKGFLQWGFNFYYSQLSLKQIDPFAETSAIEAFPAGDGFIVYPGPNGEPISSLRQYLVCEAMQDLRAMQLLVNLTDYETVLSIIEKFGEITFKKYPKTAEELISIREEINRKIEENYTA
jgi:hypothetical protein